MILVLTRHGARGEIEEADEKQKGGVSELTGNGQSQMYQLGKQLGRRY